jgi:uncharacterized lipoprotein YddW (UPF0748 family)
VGDAAVRFLSGPRFLLVALLGGARLLAAPPSDRPEIRAIWVDAFGPGIRTPEEAEELVLEAKRANLNLLFVQVRRRGDALYTRGFEPPLDAPAYDPRFDALENVIRVAHREGLAVHAWVNAMSLWRNEAPPCDARHLFNRHGPAAHGDELWLTTAPDGTTLFPVGTFLDPGHPGVQAYLASIYANLVREYDLDGIHFDYIRYPETEGSPARGSAVGYNPAALARFRRATGRTDTPEPGDEEWMAWRRRQVDHVVRRVYLEAKSLKPKLVVSASVIPWGAPPTNEDDFASVAPMQRVFQDWHGWLKEGILDLAVPMNYARETDDRVRSWFDGWISWERTHQHERRTVAGLGGYRNSPDATLAQVARARAGSGRDRLAGVSLFSYRVPVGGAAEPDPSAVTGPPGERLLFLSAGTPAAPGPFQLPAPLPSLPWLDRPERGAVAGVVAAANREETDDVGVEIRRKGWFRKTRRVRTDANGFFGLTGLAPGRYRVRLAGAREPDTTTFVVVSAGSVTRTELSARASR